MEPKHSIHSQDSRAYSARNALWKDARKRQSHVKRAQTYTKSELASLLGVRITELGNLGRMGMFQRIGEDRYLLDSHLPALALGKQQRTISHDAITRGLGTSSPAAVLLDARSHPESRDRYQKVADFYLFHDNLIENSVNIVSVPNIQYATVTAGFFLKEGLLNNERVVVLSFEHPDMLFSRFAEAGLMFNDALQTEKLIYLYYKPDVAHSISLSVDYRELFGEVMKLGGEDVKRLVLFNVDALINANSEHLVHTSLHQLIYAANHYQVILLGLFVASGHVAELLDEGCRAILPGYYVMD